MYSYIGWIHSTKLSLDPGNYPNGCIFLSNREDIFHWSNQQVGPSPWTHVKLVNIPSARTSHMETCKNHPTSSSVHLAASHSRGRLFWLIDSPLGSLANFTWPSASQLQLAKSCTAVGLGPPRWGLTIHPGGELPEVQTNWIQIWLRNGSK